MIASQILAGESAGLYMQLRACRKLDLAKICDVNDQLGDDMLLYRLDPGKVTAWLSQVRSTEIRLAV